MKSITVSEFKKLDSKSYMLIDVRNDFEIEKGKIPGCVCIHMNEIENKLDDIPKDKKIILYCHSGGRSAFVSEFLNSKGYDSYNLLGGIRSWLKDK